MAQVRSALGSLLGVLGTRGRPARGQDILNQLNARFDCQQVAYGPYFFADLAGTSDADEQVAIDGGLIQANRIQYAGRRKGPPPATSA
jgi:hypothetical protein